MDRSDTQRIADTVTRWPGVQTDRLPHDGLDFLLGCREIGHVHGHQHVDIPFSRPLRDELVAAGRALPHHLLAQSGWVTVPLNSSHDIDQAIALLKLSYDLALSN